MRLWTMQPVSILTEINRKGAVTCTTALSENFHDFKDAYLWMSEKMTERGIKNPDNVVLPLWAWHTFDGKHKKPDLRHSGYMSTGTDAVCIEFEIPDDEVLLSGFVEWHSVLNDGYYIDAVDDKEWERLYAEYDRLPVNKKEEVKRKSWMRIFNVSDCQYIQATFWKLDKSMIKKITHFKAR